MGLTGTVRTQDGNAVDKATVRVIAPDKMLNGHPAAAVLHPGTVSWRRKTKGLTGSLLDCWQQHVATTVAGITWNEFKTQVLVHNPILVQDGERFQADKTYLLPEQSGGTMVLWMRELAGFYGNRWECWRDFVQSKVVGITWTEFMKAVLEHNPDLPVDKPVFQADKTYVLPENPPVPDEVVWTRREPGFSGNRWEYWDAHVSGRVQGITWTEFRTGVVERNPVLAEDKFVFAETKSYLLPENPDTPYYYLYAETDAQGRFAFTDLSVPGDYTLIVRAPGCFQVYEQLSIQDDTTHDVSIRSKASQMVSHWKGYATASAPVRRLIDQALSMLGDDPIAYDALPLEIRKLAFGFSRQDPNDLYHKDIVCADLISICLSVAGVDLGWQVTHPPNTAYIGTHAANYYRPREDHPLLREVKEGEEWLPGDILIYWDGDLAANRLRHVNLYVGPYSGVDNSGRHHPQSKGYDVVNASINWRTDGGEKRGTVIDPDTHQACISGRSGKDHVMRMRHRQLEREHSLGGAPAPEDEVSAPPVAPPSHPPEHEALRVQVESPVDGTLNIRPERSLDNEPLEQVDHKELLICLDPEHEVHAKVGKDGHWLHVRTSDGVDGFASALFLRLPEPEAGLTLQPALPITGGVSKLSVWPEPSTVRPFLTQVDGDALLTALEPAGEVRAKVGEPKEWILVRTAQGKQGYVAATLVEVAEEPVPLILTHVVVQNSVGLNLRSGAGTEHEKLWHVQDRTTLQTLEEPQVVAEKLARGGWFHVRPPSLHDGWGSGKLIRAVAQEDQRKKVRVESVPEGESPYIFGIHAAEPGSDYSQFDFRDLFVNKPRRGWVLFAESIGSDPAANFDFHDFSPWSSPSGAGMGVIMRLNHGWPGQGGTLPQHSLYKKFAATCAKYAKRSKGCHIWIIGNEPNNSNEYPNSGSASLGAITAEMCAEAYNLAREQIKKVQQNAIVVPAALDPTRGDQGPPLDYFKTMLKNIEKLDGIALHAYTHGPEVHRITSLGTFEHDPLKSHYYDFRSYRAFAEAIPAKWHDRPIYITESNHLTIASSGSGAKKHGWSNQARAWVEAAYREIDDWNNSPYAPQIHCLLLYRWQGDDWTFNNNGNVKQGLLDALENDYRWRH